MTGGGHIPVSYEDDYDLERAGHSVQWVGTPGVKGPSWARLPLLTVGMLGTQVVWSIEMGYASPFLLELGLSKSWMSLVFMAGPLSGLIVQPLIGAYADRSRSRFGRRRPFMLAGTAIAVVGMMLLGWAREVAGLFGLGTWAAIAVAVFSIYLIDFSINAVMSTDRALIVDTLPSSQQEEGNAWAGRMMGFGGVAGFFVGNVDVTHILSFLGKTQLQILSFLTSAVLALAHTSTSWAVTERVLLRDDRPQSRSGLLSSLRAIWTNMFTLPPSIRIICYIQFFANLGWYPILFFTSIWIADIYKQTNPQGDRTTETWEAEAVRAGSRALFMQSLISLAVSVASPFFVSDSGIMPGGSSGPAYSQLRSSGDDEDAEPNSATFKRHAEERLRGLSIPQRAAAAVASVIKAAIRAIKTGSAWALPIKGLTLIRLWIIAQIVFTLCMFSTFFTSTVSGAYCVIAMTGFSWALAQWAPFALLGELVLIDSPDAGNRTEMRTLVHASPSEVVFAHDANRPATSPLHSRSVSRAHTRLPSHETVAANDVHPLSAAHADPIAGQRDSVDLEIDTTVVLRHSDEHSEEDIEDIPASASSVDPGPSTADKAGLILGIHNVFIVLPQFVITFVSSIIFALLDPGTTKASAHAERAEMPDAPSSPNAVAIVFRIGGLAAAFGAYLSYRLSRRWQTMGPG